MNNDNEKPGINKMTLYHVINGPNLNLLGTREPEIYGHKSLKDIEAWVAAQWKSEGITFVWKQSNHEGELIDFIHQAIAQGVQGLIINPGAYAHSSLAIADALRILKAPKIEVHISNVFKRDSLRQTLLTASACDSIMSGPSFVVYNCAVQALRHIHQG